MDEPTMPAFGEGMETPEEVNAYEQHKPEGEEPTNEPSEQEGGEIPAESPAEGEMPSDADGNVDGDGPKDGGAEGEQSEGEKNYNGVIEGWAEDRLELDKSRKEVIELRNKLSRQEESEHDSEFSDLSEDERVEAIIAKRAEDEVNAKKAQDAEISSEINFLTRKDPYFGPNKAKILENAVTYNCNSLEQAMMITKGQDAFKQKPKHDPQKIQRDRMANRAPRDEGKPKPKSDESYGDMFRSGGI